MGLALVGTKLDGLMVGPLVAATCRVHARDGVKLGVSGDVTW